jgi:predicted tellurium resistance membrane protein TerC
MIEPELILSLLTLTLLEVVLGIDNVIFIALLVQKLPLAMARKARIIGLSLALAMRILFLLMISWIIGLTEPVFEFGILAPSGRDLMFFFGGGFLIVKVTKELIEEFSPQQHEATVTFKGGFIAAIIQIVIIDLVFSFDSVITAVGLTTNIPIIIIAMTIAMLAMLFTSEWIAGFIRQNPGIKMLALAFIFLIGAYLVSESFGVHFDKGYIYAAMGFSLVVEILNMLQRRKKAGKKATLEKVVTVPDSGKKKL